MSSGPVVLQSFHINSLSLFLINADGSIFVSKDKDLEFSTSSAVITANLPWKSIVQTDDEMSVYLVDSSSKVFYFRDNFDSAIDTNFTIPANCRPESIIGYSSTVKMFCVGKNANSENVGKWIYSKTLQDSLSKSSLIIKSGISKCSLNVDVQVNDFGTEKSSKIRELSFWPKKQATVRLQLTSETQRVPKVYFLLEGIKLSNSYETVMKHAMSKKA